MTQTEQVILRALYALIEERLGYIAKPATQYPIAAVAALEESAANIKALLDDQH